MNKFSLLVAAFMTILPVSFVEAQTSSPSVNQLLNRGNELLRELEPEIQRLERESERYQSYLDDLFQQCIDGDNSACVEHNRRLDAINRRLDIEIERTDPNNPRNRRWAESFCQPYCN